MPKKESEKRCKHEGCKCPSQFVKYDGYCHAHGPGSKERLEILGLKGGAAMKAKMRKSGLKEEELPPLVDHAAAKKWLEVLGRAVACGRIGATESRAAIGAVEAWLKATSEEATMRIVQELREDVERIKSGLRAA